MPKYLKTLHESERRNLCKYLPKNAIYICCLYLHHGSGSALMSKKAVSIVLLWQNMWSGVCRKGHDGKGS